MKKPDLRLGLLCLVAASVGLSLALISISKLLLVVCFLVLMVRGIGAPARLAALTDLWTPRLVAVVILLFICSLLWTTAPLYQALGALGKYGKFLVIPALLVMVRTRREAAWVLASFLGAQMFLLVSSWLLYFHVPLLWATSNMSKTFYAVFSSYLDQGIMSAVMAAVFWHLRELAPNRNLRRLLVAMSLLALGCVFVVFIGRTGHLVGLAVMSLAVFWALPRKYRLASLLIPALMCVLVYASFDKVAQRFSAARAELSAYSAKPEAVTSLGVRLSFWTASVALIAEKPLIGSGVGSWATQYNQMEHVRNPDHQSLGVGSNPHEEFLLWGVQLGVGGVLLLLALLGAVLRDLQKMDLPVTRAGQSVVLGLVLSCLFNSSIYDAYIGDFFCLALAVLLVFGWRMRFDRHARAPAGTPVAPAAMWAGLVRKVDHE